MCFWDEMAFFNCDGTVERQKHLCQRVPLDHNGRRRAGVEMCKNDEMTPPLLGCRHSETSRTIPHQAIYRHVCDREGSKADRSYNPPGGSGMLRRPTKWTPVIKEAPFSAFITGTSRDGGTLKDSVQFRWCVGSLRTVEEVFGKNAPGFNWRGVDLLSLEDEAEVRKLVGKGTYEYWVGVWSGSQEAEIATREEGEVK